MAARNHPLILNFDKILKWAQKWAALETFWARARAQGHEKIERECERERNLSCWARALSNFLSALKLWYFVIILHNVQQQGQQSNFKGPLVDTILAVKNIILFCGNFCNTLLLDRGTVDTKIKHPRYKIPVNCSFPYKENKCYLQSIR